MMARIRIGSCLLIFITAFCGLALDCSDDDDKSDDDESGDEDDTAGSNCDNADICKRIIQCKPSSWDSEAECSNGVDQQKAACPDPKVFYDCLCGCVETYPDCSDYPTCIIGCHFGAC